MCENLGMEVLLSENGRLSIDQCEAIARKVSADGKDCTFLLCGPKGKKEAKWLDPYLGFFQVDGQDGFMTTSQFRFTDVWCESVLWGRRGDP